MKKIYASIVIILLALSASVAQADGHSKKGIYAVTFHADWCGSCKALEPNMIKARGKSDLDNKSVLFVTLDLTNATTRHQSKLMSEAIGIGDYYSENEGKTGFVLLVDASTGKPLDMITSKMDANQIVGKITKHI